MKMFNLLIAASGSFDDIGDMIADLYSQMWGPLLGILVGAAALLGLWLGLKFVFAGGDEQKTKKAKDSIKYFILGIAIIFIVAGLLPVIIAAFQNWMK